MSRSKYLMAGGVLLVILLLVGASVTFANIQYAQEGTVQVVTQWGAIERVYKPSDGWFTTIAPGRRAYEVNVKSFTENAPVRVTSRDNAPSRWNFRHRHTPRTSTSTCADGFNEDAPRRRSEIPRASPDRGANSFFEYGAYRFRQQEDSKSIIESLRPQLAATPTRKIR